MPTIHSNQSNDSGLHIKLPRLAGFTLLEPLHEGSCGLIYRARQDRLGRIVALKLLPEWPPPTDVALERFNRAAYVNAQAPHPNLLTLYDTGTKDGFHFVSLEYVNGQTLQKHLSTVGTSDERFALQVATHVLRALAALHARDICHRNLKPKNIFLETNGNVRLIGTGLASCKTAFFSPHLDARPIGTPHFMAPEMIRGCYADPRSDLYSLGITLYVMVTGRTPFEKGAPLAVMSRHLTDVPESLGHARPGLSPDFVKFVDTLMAKEPEHRFQSAKAALEMAESLSRRFVEPPRLLPEMMARPAQLPGMPLMVSVPRRSIGDKLRHPAAIAVVSAIVTVLFLAGMMTAMSRYIASRQNMPTTVTTPIPLTAEADEFSKLLDQDADFRLAPETRSEAWATYIAKNPGAPPERLKIARQRLDLFINQQNRRREQTQPAEKAKQDLEF